MYKVLTCVHITVHRSHTQHSTEQFWLSSLLFSRQATELRCCLLEVRGQPNVLKHAIKWIQYSA